MWQCTANGKELAYAFYKLIIDMAESETHYNPEYMEVRRNCYMYLKITQYKINSSSCVSK